MKITKYVHSCLLVETDGRVALFDPGVMSTGELPLESLTQLDDIFITHIHPDHLDQAFIRQAVAKFPDVRITAPDEVVEQLAGDNIKASSDVPDGVKLFDSPHEDVMPIFPAPTQAGYHYLDTLSHPGDSHSFKETMPILALPVTAPWGSSVKAMRLAFELKPKHILPIHDWHWREEARGMMYGRFEELCHEQGITFHKLETGKPVEITL